jgi:hypothetical protein
MATVFLSYSTKDHLFAELTSIKLGESNITLWRDHGQLRAGEEWRIGIERGIADSMAVLVALSQNSVESPYVTFEWAYALGKGRNVIPLKLDGSKVHSRLEPIQYLDFSVPGSLPWNLLVERIREIEADATAKDDLSAASILLPPLQQPDPMVKAILTYLNQRGYQMVSYDRLRKRVNSNLTDPILDKLVDDNPTVFRRVVLTDDKPGLAKRIP